MIELNFLGPTQILAGGRSITSQLDKKELALLAYLAAQRDEVSRDKAADLLWGDKDDQRARQNLRQAVSNIKRLIPGTIEAQGHHVLTLGQAVVAHTDLRQFDDLLRCGDLAGACALYRGPLLDGLSLRDTPAFEDWLSERRSYYEQRALDALSALLGQAHTQADSAAQETYARQMLAINPLKERATRALMLALSRRGQFNAALEAYNQCATMLQRELGVAPSAETAAVYERILLARAAPRRPLPFTGVAFVGRERELAEAAALLAQPDCRLLTLLGPGGVGKTRLAIELARRAQGMFLHGVCYVPLESYGVGVSEEDLWAAVAGALALRISGGNIRSQVIEFLRPRELLVVLDNFELLAPVAGGLTALLRQTRDVKLLVATRQRPDVPDETIYLVGGLSYPAEDGPLPRPTETLNNYDAPALLAHNVARLNPELDLLAATHDIVRICRLVEGLPLALEMVAPWLLTLSPAAVADKLAANVPDLLEYERNFPDRHRTLHGVFEHSWATLSPAEQRAFRRLGVVAGIISPAAAETIAGATKALLRSLARRSMVEIPDRQSYRLHPLLRAFALAKLEAAGETREARESHYTYFQQYVNARLPQLRGPEQLTALQAMTAELENVRAACRFGAANAGAATLHPLLNGLTRLLNDRTLYALGIEALAEAAEPLARRGLDDLYGRLLLHQGSFHFYQGNYDKARQLADKGLGIAEAQGDEWAVAVGLRLLGSIFYDDNHYDEAEALWNRSLALFVQQADWEAAADCHISLGNAAILKNFFSPAGKKPYRPPCAFFQEHYLPTPSVRAGAQAAIAHFNEALRLQTMIENVAGIATYWSVIGFPYYVLHDYETAATAYREAIARFSLLDASDNLVQCHTWLAWVLTWQGKMDEARIQFHKSLRLMTAGHANKRLLDCLQKYSLFLWVKDRQHFTPLAINAFVADHPNTGTRMKVVADEWLKNIAYFMRQDEGQAAVDKAIAYGRRQTLGGLVHHLLGG